MHHKPTYEELEKRVRELENVEIELKRKEESLHKSKNRLRSIIDSAPFGAHVYQLNDDGKLIFSGFNTAAEKILGVKHQQFLGRSIIDAFPGLAETPIPEAYRRVAETGEPYFTEQIEYDEQSIKGAFEVSAVHIEKKQIAVFFRDITERARAEERQRREEQYNRMLVDMLDSAPNSIVVLDTDMRFLYANRKTFEMHGYDKDEFMALTLQDVDEPESREFLQERISTVLEKGEATFTVGHFRKDGSILPMNVYAKSVEWEGRQAFLNIATDITESKQAEQKRKSLEDQLHQAQKIEAIGRLAGGVAHDFNNMLSLIIGHADMALRRMEPSHPLYNSLQEIRKAGERSADLTRQLLAFARKQTTAPRKLDLNETVKGMLQMLRRLIGEHIELVWIAGKNLWPVKVDPSQVDQILANLCVNSRDAIVDVGRITIETDNAVLDDFYCKDHIGFEPGEYVRLAVSDNGSGMDAETLGKIFEPFFTTKEVGRGTGLGLATIYGIVKQNNGLINVYSELSQGTTFRIYLPRHLTATAELPEKIATQPVQGGHETIMIVEDEPAILKMSRMMLETLGYTVVTAGTPGEAISIVQEYAGDIDLLLTDVVMPEMNGRDLAKHILSFFPNLKALFMSGYTANVIAHHGVLDDGVNFIQKPFSRRTLGAKVREVLGTNNQIPTGSSISQSGNER